MNAIQLPFHFDAALIQQELAAIANTFTTIHSIRIKENHLMGLHLITPRPEGKKDDRGYTYLSSSQLEQSSYLQSILENFSCDKFIYRVHNLRAGGKIALHRDSDRGLSHGIVRVHVPVTSNENIYFYVNGERVQMGNGECWWADISQLHEVENCSEQDRWQLMIDCELNDWWKAIFKAQGFDLDRTSKWAGYSLVELQKMKESLAQIGEGRPQEVLQEIEAEMAGRGV